MRGAGALIENSRTTTGERATFYTPTAIDSFGRLFAGGAELASSSFAFSCMTCSKAVTTAGSNCFPAASRIMATASWGVRPRRQGRSVMIAS